MENAKFYFTHFEMNEGKMRQMKPDDLKDIFLTKFIDQAIRKGDRFLFYSDSNEIQCDDVIRIFEETGL